MTDKQTNDIIFILDKSGSMTSMGKEPQESLNEFINEQKELAKELNDGSRFTLYTFNQKMDLVVNDVPLVDVEAYKGFFPSGLTSLYDTIGSAINNKLSSKNPRNTVCVILTDGDDNCSQTFTADSIKNLMTNTETEYGWKFIFLAANQDAFSVGATIGVEHGRCSSFAATPEGMRGVCKGASNAIRSYRTSTNSGDENAKLSM
jgi:hypothetical protein